jgi:hypothetical protein
VSKTFSIKFGTVFPLQKVSSSCMHFLTSLTAKYKVTPSRILRIVNSTFEIWADGVSKSPRLDVYVCLSVSLST